MNNVIETGIVVTALEVDMIKKRFARMYPNNKPLEDKEAETIVFALKCDRSWLRVYKEETAR